MFTGLIKDIGTIKSFSRNPSGAKIVIQSKKLIEEIAIDDSVATNGVCLTATHVSDDSFSVQAVHVTLEKSNLGALKAGDKVNLELALRATDRLGGHLVQGHVNGIGKITNIKQLGNNWEFHFKTEPSLYKYMIKEGSICIDGISLTIANIDKTNFSVSIIPHTYENTILYTKKIGDSVNIEVDMMAKYLENFVKFDSNNKNLMELMKD